MRPTRMARSTLADTSPSTRSETTRRRPSGPSSTRTLTDASEPASAGHSVTGGSGGALDGLAATLMQVLAGNGRLPAVSPNGHAAAAAEPVEEAGAEEAEVQPVG